MSGYLWGIGQLINDPSTHLITAIHKSIFKKEYVYTASSNTRCKEKPELAAVLSSSNNTNNKTNDSGCVASSSSKKVCELPRVKSESVQVSGLTRRRHVSTQCHGSVCKKLSRTTSSQQIDQLDRGTVVSYTVCSVTGAKKDVGTNTDKRKLCDQHRYVFAELCDWPKFNNRYGSSKDSGVFAQIKSRISSLVENCNIQKIECIPPYRPPEEQIVKLYKSANYENLAAEVVKSRQRKIQAQKRKTLKHITVS